METNLRKSSGTLLGVTALLALASALSGCGKQAYVVTSLVQQQKAPGNFMVPPKVDILLAEDDSGSIKSIYDTVDRSTRAFLAGLDAKGWDYHFATIPLTTDRPLDQVVGSRYDANWGSAWLPPFPGATPDTMLGTLDASVFRSLSQYAGFLTFADTSNTMNGQEPGFLNMESALYDRAPGTNFLRDDALLVMLVVGNGDDTSDVTYCQRNDGWVAPCERVSQLSRTGKCWRNGAEATCPASGGTQEASLSYYKDAFLATKAHLATTAERMAQVRFFAAVANGTTCLGEPSYKGDRYQKMAAALRGKSYDLCNQSLAGVLDSLSGELQAIKIGMRTRYLFIDQDADVASITVTRYVNGDLAQPLVLPMISPANPDNGWSYAGHVTNVASIDSPIPMNYASGFAIELHGTAKLVGDDTASVTFKPAGTSNSVSE